MMQQGRDYSLTGPEGARAVGRGLVDADWYRPAIDPARFRELTTRTDARALRDTALWLALLVAAALWAWNAWGTWWALPAFAVYGALYGGAADARWHEMGHGTAFATPWLNDLVYPVASFMLWREPTVWRWSHARHHTDTIVVGRDPEIAFPRPPRWLAVAAAFAGRGAVGLLPRIFVHATGRIDPQAATYVPEADHRRVVREARVFVAILAAVVGLCVATRSILPLLFVGLPTVYGQWLMVFFGITQHAGLAEDVTDHRRNTRTVLMNPVLRFLYSNMNYHLEHHLFPTVPYHRLPDLHAEIAPSLRPPLGSTFAAYREVFGALRRQRRDPGYEIERSGALEVASASPAQPSASDAEPVAQGGEIDLGPMDEVAVGEIRRVDHGGRSYVLCRPTADVVALVDGWCTHGRAHLADGVLVGCEIECPKHNGRFDLVTGDPRRRPATAPLAVHDVVVVDGRLRSRTGGGVDAGP